MAHIRRRSDYRYRIQFTMNYELNERYVACKERAKSLRLSIEFGSDFESWFAGQLQGIERQLDEVERDIQPAKDKQVSREGHHEF